MSEIQVTLLVGFGGVFIAALLSALSQYLFLRYESKESLKIEIARRLLENLWEVKDVLARLATFSIELQERYDKISIDDLKMDLEKYAREYVNNTKGVLHSYFLFQPLFKKDLNMLRIKLNEWGPILFTYPDKLDINYINQLQTRIWDIRKELIAFEVTIINEMYRKVV